MNFTIYGFTLPLKDFLLRQINHKYGNIENNSIEDYFMTNNYYTLFVDINDTGNSYISLEKVKSLNLNESNIVSIFRYYMLSTHFINEWITLDNMVVIGLRGDDIDLKNIEVCDYFMSRINEFKNKYNCQDIEECIISLKRNDDMYEIVNKIPLKFKIL